MATFRNATAESFADHNPTGELCGTKATFSVALNVLKIIAYVAGNGAVNRVMRVAIYPDNRGYIDGDTLQADSARPIEDLKG